LKKPAHLFPLHSEPVSRHRYDFPIAPLQHQFEFWKERIGDMLEMSPKLVQFERGLSFQMDHFIIGELSYSVIYSNPVRIERSLARISTDHLCNLFLISVCIDMSWHLMGKEHDEQYPPRKKKLLALDILCQLIKSKKFTIILRYHFTQWISSYQPQPGRYTKTTLMGPSHCREFCLRME